MSDEAAETPSALFERVAGAPGVAFLDGRAASPRAPLSHVAWAPEHSFRAWADGRTAVDGRESRGDPLAALDRFLDTESSAGRTVIGAVGYDLRSWIEPRSGAPRTDLPLVAASSYSCGYTYDHLRGSWLTTPPVLPGRRPGSVTTSRPRPNVDCAEYGRRFERAQEWIRAGDVYQVNLSISFEADIRGDAAVLYQRLARDSPAPYGAFVDFGDFQILSNSPELFLARRGAGVATRPIKGTRPRGATARADAGLIEELRRDAKERAEHLMIVDLERNDLGRIAEIGSIRVEEFAAVESYATLHHLESTVCGKVSPGLPFSAFLRALFPGGSITGAPKIRAMQILEELETEGRGFYTGGILHYPPDRDFSMSICIRTATVRGGRIRYAAGGGLVADSNVEAEHAECLLKARAFFAAAAGEEPR